MIGTSVRLGGGGIDGMVGSSIREDMEGAVSATTKHIISIVSIVPIVSIRVGLVAVRAGAKGQLAVGEGSGKMALELAQILVKEVEIDLALSGGIPLVEALSVVDGVCTSTEVSCLAPGESIIELDDVLAGQTVHGFEGFDFASGLFLESDVDLVAPPDQLVGLVAEITARFLGQRLGQLDLQLGAGTKHLRPGSHRRQDRGRVLALVSCWFWG